MNRYGSSIMVPPLSPMVKRLIIANLVIWFFLQVIVENFLFPGLITYYFGLVPSTILKSFFIWQPFTYMFLHAHEVSHILMNMLLLWFVGNELEQRWGSRFFLLYYLVCGFGAGIIYVVGMGIYSLFSANPAVLGVPVVGASGAIFGLLLAYGIIFGDRVVHFFFLFPMRAKHFVMLLGAIEFLTLLTSGGPGQSRVANLAHLGGLIVGFLFLMIWTRLQKQRSGRRARPESRKLRLVVNNPSSKSGENQPPRYWN